MTVMVSNDPARSNTSHRRWRDLIDTFLAQFLDASQCACAAYIDTLVGRERYVFSTSGEPLPDINWHQLITELWLDQLSSPGYRILISENISNAPDCPIASQLISGGQCDIIVSIPLMEGETLLGAACGFGKIPPADPFYILEFMRDNLEGLARITSCALAVIMDEAVSSSDRSIHQKALSTLPEGLLMTDKLGVVIEANEVFSSLTGIPHDSLLGRNLMEQPILDIDCDFLIARLLENNQPFEVITRLGSENCGINDDILIDDDIAPGKYLRLRGTICGVDGDNASGMILLADDVTREVLAKREATRRERRHSREIELASRLQQNFFPANFQKKRIRIATRLIAAHELAGDFFDIFDLGPSTIVLVIGDVVGKGIPSSLMAMSVHGMLANQAGALTPPMKVLERVNEGLFQQVKGEYWYATCFYAKFHVTELRLTYSRAGHEMPLWWHKETGEVTFLEGEGLPLGLFPDSTYVTMQVHINEGDRMLFYTDGLTDAINPVGERFGHERLVELFKKYCTLSSKNFLKVIENEIREFQGGRQQLDDIAIALLTAVPDSWTTLSIPPFTFKEVLEGLLDDLRLRGCDEDVIFKVRLSLDECVTNAFRHGHMGDDRRPVTISYISESDRVIVKVKDQGQGFDFSLIPDPTLRENLMSPGGRGVYLALKMMDEVSFNDVGNEVTMVKYLHRPNGGLI